MKKLFLFLIFTNLLFSQTNKINLGFPKEPKISEKFQASIDNKKNEVYSIYQNNVEGIKNYTVEFILDKIDNNKEYGYLMEAEYWIAFNYDKIIPQLINRIVNKKEVGLVNSADLIILERIESGDLQSYGHGFIVNDDFFTIAGRANRLLTVITGENFGSVSMNSSPQDLLMLQKKWIAWLQNI
ncbi:hypothetical protein [Flavobacterium hungaricum]|uniref:Uncharacterized protein n=1 Tax=Flavobacterium hungaricum TaxID=2082725 RepID=A0ABR9TPM9_9FLAO|nr:hypothetical protein [Flavobacterium hungaricum]MBE8727318.1 hypothetical protein [Flavobacterium hungaricum]